MKTLLQLAAALQLSILVASALVPHVLNWRRNLSVLHPFLRRLFWVYGAFIVLIIISFAVLTFVHADAMAGAEPVARSLCLFIATFWAVRLVVQFAVFDARPFLTNWFYRLGYHGLTIVFALLVIIYTTAAFHLDSALVPSVGASPVRIDRVSRSRILNFYSAEGEACFDETVRAGLALQPRRETRVLPRTLRTISPSVGNAAQETTP